MGILLCIAPLRQTEKQEAIPAGAGDLARDCAQGTVAARLILESFSEHLDDDLPIPQTSGQQGARFWQPVVLPRSRAIGALGTRLKSSHEFLRGSNTEVAV